MSGPRVGGLFAGYGGLEMALHDVFGAEPAWFAEFEPPKKPGGKSPRQAAAMILAQHWPDVPNHGDVTTVKWTPDCPVCGRLTAVYRRDGQIGPGQEAFYWCPTCEREWDLSIRLDEMARTGVPIPEPVDIIAGGSPCQDVSHAGKRAGMKAGTRSGLWASMVDAIDSIRPSLVVWENVHGALSAEATSAVEPCPICMGDGSRVTLRALGRVLGDLAELGYDAAWTGLRAADVGAPHGRFRVFVVAWPQSDPGALLPTPAVNDMSAAYDPDEWDEWTARMRTEHGNGNGHGKSLHVEALRLLPTPRVKNNENRQSEGYGGEDGNFYGLLHNPERWGIYAPAIARWESIFRAAPAPTEPTGKGGAHRLSPRFVEWMQGLPEGHVTDVPGITHNDMLKALGNGVVPQQGAEGVRRCIAIARTTEAVAS